MKKVGMIVAALALALCSFGCAPAPEEMVEITIPAQWSTENEAFNMDDLLGEESAFESVETNADGSVTITMTKSEHDELMAKVREAYDAGLTELLQSDAYSTITDVKANDDYTEFEVYIDGEQLGLAESMSSLVFYMYGGLYGILSGNPAEGARVDFINANTGEIIDSADSRNAGSGTSAE